MSAATNGKAGLSLFLVQGRWLLGRVTRCATGITLSEPAQYDGGIVRREGGMGLGRVVSPISGLCTLRRLDVPAEAIEVPLSDLGPQEAKDIERHYEQCCEMVGAIRAEMSGIKPVRLVLP